MTNTPYSDRTAFNEDKKDGIDIGFLTLTGIDQHYVRSFYDAAELLVGTLLPGHNLGRNDRLVFAACFLFRHYLELQCKYLIEAAWHLDNPGAYDGKIGHSLKELWDKARKVVEPKIADSTTVPFDSVQSIIYQFHAADPTGQEFRYSQTRKGYESLRNIPSSFSAQSLYDAMMRAGTFLNNWAVTLDTMFDSDNYVDH